MAVVGRIELAQRAGSGPPWGLVASVASKQHGVVGRWQLLELGLTPSSIQRGVGRGLLHPVFQGAYAAGFGALNRNARLMAAVLVGGENAMLSHRTGGALLRMIVSYPNRIDVTAIRCGRSRHDGILVHRPRRLPLEERWIRDGIPVTSASRTLIDLAAILSQRELREAVHAADRHRILHIDRIERMLRATPGRHGTDKLESILSTYRPMPDSRSWLQDRFLFECDLAGIPRPAVDVVVEGFEVDCLWPAERLIVELDSYGYHGDPDAFETDRRRDVILTLAGYTVLRFTYERVTADPAGVVREVLAALERARGAGAGPNRVR
jgi:hypothetical protein